MNVSNWLLLRGLGRDSRHWMDFPDQLKDRGYEVLCLDLPGFGTEAHRSSPLTISGIAEDVRQRFRPHIKQESRWGIIGISLGGMVSLEWCSSHPSDFVKSVVINVSSRDSGNFWQRVSPFGMFKTLEALFQNRNIPEREKAILEMVSNLRKKDPELLKQLIEIAQSVDISFFNFSKELVAASRFMAPENIEIPCLFLASLKDHMVDVRCSKLLAERLKQNIKFHPTAGHDLPMDDPDWVIERIAEFELAEPDPKAAL